MKALVIANPIAGKGRPVLSESKIVAMFRSHGLDCEVLFTSRAGDGKSIARKVAEHGYGPVVAAGGDGTVNEVANGLAGTRVPMGILPLGTVNVLARELKIPLELEGAVRTIAKGKPRDIDLGFTNGRYFTLMAGFGFDAEVVGSVLQPVKDVIGASAYIFKGLEMLLKYEPSHVTLEMPEETYRAEAFLVIAANASTYTYNLKISSHVSLSDGKMDILVFERPISDKIGFIHQVTDMLVNRHLQHKAIKYFCTTSVSIRSNPPIMAQIDGDAFGCTPLKLSIAPGVLPIII